MNAIGHLDEHLVFESNNYLYLYHQISKIVDATDLHILEMFSKSLTYLQTIPSIGDICATTTMVEIGDVKRFIHSDILVAFARLDPACH